MKTIRCFMLLWAFVFLACDAMAQTPDKDYAECLVKTSTLHGTRCAQCPSDEYTMRIYVTNRCKDKLEVKLAMQEESKKIRIFNALALSPGDSLSGYICEGNARFYYWARKAGDKSVTIPTDQEINKAYGK